MYRDAISKISITDKVSSITSSEHFLKLKDIPDIYENAVVAVEDHRFYTHSGIDYFATIRAVIKNLIDGNLSQGGSTITQQLAKNLYFTQAKRFDRKIAELFVAWHLEKDYSKDEILELYINTIYYGKGYIGLYDAVKGFYDKEAMEMTDYEATYLAGIPNAPSIYSSSKYSELAKKRHLQVLNAMVKYNYLSQEEANTIYSE